jgi:hypothetical protein
MSNTDVTAIISSVLIVSLTVSDSAIAQLLQQDPNLIEAAENPNVLMETILRRVSQSKRKCKSQLIEFRYEVTREKGMERPLLDHIKIVVVLPCRSIKPKNGEGFTQCNRHFCRVARSFDIELSHAVGTE